MNVLWIVPDKLKCGISIYSKDYCESLKNLVMFQSIDPQKWISDRSTILRMLSDAEIVHIQYDTNFFYDKMHNYYLNIVHVIKVPLVVTLHEVYEEFPLVYPRSKIGGIWPLKMLKTILYDIKHPYQTDFRKHLRKQFGADKIIVHHQYHKRILKQNNVGVNKIDVIPLMVKDVEKKPVFRWKKGKILHLGSTGFITPHFNFDLLFSVLEKLNLPWTFTWIGGTRMKEHNELLNNIMERIKIAGWTERFTFSGWVEEHVQREYLRKIDLYFALFLHRSASASLTRAIAALKPIIAIDLPMTQEIAMSVIKPIHLVQNDVDSVIDGVEKIIYNDKYRNNLLNGLKTYADSIDISVTSKSTYDLYRSVCKK